ncbi:unnamed protein product [Meloidogyne enterolobii]|uniref:Uncharacterized protein n=1 Tax=Meloidogyne enterolobii TaxID=390850 RepID=A0ACB0Z6J9_MELEN
MSTPKLFIFLILIIKIVNCGICSSRPQVYEGNNAEDNNNVGRGNFAGNYGDQILDIESDLVN